MSALLTACPEHPEGTGIACLDCRAARRRCERYVRDCGPCGTARLEHARALGPNVEVRIEDLARCDHHEGRAWEERNVRGTPIGEVDAHRERPGCVGAVALALDMGDEIEVEVAGVEVEDGSVVVELDGHRRRLSVRVEFGLSVGEVSS